MTNMRPGVLPELGENEYAIGTSPTKERIDPKAINEGSKSKDEIPKKTLMGLDSESAITQNFAPASLTLLTKIENAGIILIACQAVICHVPLIISVISSDEGWLSDGSRLSKSHFERNNKIKIMTNITTSIKKADQ